MSLLPYWDIYHRETGRERGRSKVEIIYTLTNVICKNVISLFSFIIVSPVKQINLCLLVIYIYFLKLVYIFVHVLFKN